MVLRRGALENVTDASEKEATQLSPDRYRSILKSILPANPRRGEMGALLLFATAQSGGLTLGRMYLITDEQFNDVVMQGNDKTPDGSRFVPAFNQLVSQSQSNLSDKLWYGKLLNIGSEGGCPSSKRSNERWRIFVFANG